MNLDAIQKYLKENNLDGWLLADFHARNNVAVELLNITGFISRRWFCFIPAEGEIVLYHHAIEKDKFEHLPFKRVPFSGYKQMEGMLKETLKGKSKIAMEYSPMGRLPYIGLVDAGTIELIRSFGCEIITSADMVAKFKASLSDKQIESHKKAAAYTVNIKDKAFAFIADALLNNNTITEYDVVQFIAKEFAGHNMETEHDPNCSVNGNAGNPHYEPTKEGASEIKKGDLILIDLWGKIDEPNGIFADITWMAYAGSKDEIPQKYKDLFEIIKTGRDAAISYLKKNIGNKIVYGADVDDVCRAVIDKAGYGDHYPHRTGHSIASSVHGDGPNIDNLETEDKRMLQPGHLFSIEPGVYFDDCGLRTELNALIGKDGLEIHTLPNQEEILALL